MLNLPIIAGIEITTDAQGRFSLNALHKAHLKLNPEMHPDSKRPADWLKLNSTEELINELSKRENIPFKVVTPNKGRYGGTFAHELLAISYAGWISPKFQLEVNQAFIDYKTGHLQPAAPALPPLAAPVLKDQLDAYALLGAPLHYAQIEAVKYVRNTTGVDYSVALTYAPAQNAIPPEEVMLEPTELGRRHGMSAIALNRLLADHGYQKKGESGWEPTELGKAYCEKHSWSKKAKSGYNLKWRADLVDSLIDYGAVMTH